MKSLLILAAAFTLTACAGPHYSYDNPTASDSTRKTDVNQCFYEAKSQAAIAITTGNAGRNGYTSVLADDARKERLEVELFDNCLAMRGYTKRIAKS